MGSGGYINSYYNNKYERYNYDTFIANDTINEETIEDTDDETNDETNDEISDHSIFELIINKIYQIELCKKIYYYIKKIIIFFNDTISKLYKIKVYNRFLNIKNKYKIDSF
jgi:hypothetical protein